MSSMFPWSSCWGLAGRRARDPQALFVIALLGLAFTGSGCAAFSSSNSVSDSSESVSDSVSSSSDSSASSSGGDDSAYRAEVTQYVAVAVERDVSPESLRRGITEIALAHGLSDWEATTATLEAVEAGFQVAHLEDRAQYRAAFAP